MLIQLEHSFYSLNPEKVLQACELAGFEPTGRFQQLNSYENRVFEIYLEDNTSIIAKFYRPQRWTREQLQEEQEFLQELHLAGINANQSIFLSKLNSHLMNFSGIWVAFFPKIRGRLPQEFLSGELKSVGRLLARVHNVGAQKPSQFRPVMDAHFHGARSALDLIKSKIPLELANRYNQAAETIIDFFEKEIDSNEFYRIHGDCHRGNLLHSGTEFFLVDFDDFCMGPAVQDFWMLLSGDQNQEELDEILDGYCELRDFPEHQLGWIPILRGIRIISYAAWIVKRWTDPSFPRLFPQFDTYSYWAEETEQIEKISWHL